MLQHLLRELDADRLWLSNTQLLLCLIVLQRLHMVME